MRERQDCSGRTRWSPGEGGPGRGRKRSISQETIARVVHDTLHSTPPAETHWSCRSMAANAGISEATVQKIWSSRGIKPHLVRTFKRSADPRFAEKFVDVGIGRVLVVVRARESRVHGKGGQPDRSAGMAISGGRW